MRLHYCFVALLLLIGTTAAHAQVFPPDQWNAAPYEKASQQIGGHGVTLTTDAGDLRCANQGDPIVGMITRKGSVIDYVQLVCGRLVQSGGRVGWARTYYGPAAGNRQGGSLTRLAMCQANWAVMGFRAVYTADNTFVQDFRLLCAPLAGIGSLNAYAGGAAVPYLTIGGGRTDAGWTDMAHRLTSSSGHFGYSLNSQLPDDLSFVGRDGNNQPRYAESVCVGGAATAIGFANGQWVSLTGFHTVVQVFQIVCVPQVQDLVLARPPSP